MYEAEPVKSWWHSPQSNQWAMWALFCVACVGWAPVYHIIVFSLGTQTATVQGLCTPATVPVAPPLYNASVVPFVGAPLDAWVFITMLSTAHDGDFDINVAIRTAVTQSGQLVSALSGTRIIPDTVEKHLSVKGCGHGFASNTSSGMADGLFIIRYMCTGDPASTRIVARLVGGKPFTRCTTAVALKHNGTWTTDNTCYAEGRRAFGPVSSMAITPVPATEYVRQYGPGDIVPLMGAIAVHGINGTSGLTGFLTRVLVIFPSAISADRVVVHTGPRTILTVANNTLERDSMPTRNMYALVSTDFVVHHGPAHDICVGLDGVAGGPVCTSFVFDELGPGARIQRLHNALFQRHHRSRGPDELIAWDVDDIDDPVVSARLATVEAAVIAE